MTRDNFQDGAEFSAEGLDAIVNAHDNEGFESGGAPSVGTGNFDVDLTAADYVINQTEYSAGADTVTLSNPSASDRVDIITATNTPGFSVTEGTPATDPNAPTIPTDEVLIAAVFVDSGASSLASGDINDYRVFLERDAVTYKGNDIDTDGDGQVNSADSADNADTLDNLEAVQLEGHATDTDTLNNVNGSVTSSTSTLINITDTGFLLGGTAATDPDANVGLSADVIVDGTTFSIASGSDGGDNQILNIPCFRFESSLQVDITASGGTEVHSLQYILD